MIRIHYAIGALITSCICAHDASHHEKNTLSKHKRIIEKQGHVLLHAIKQHKNAYIEQELNKLSSQQLRTILFTSAQNAFTRSFACDNIEAATLLAMKMDPDDLPYWVRSEIAKHALRNGAYQYFDRLYLTMPRIRQHALEAEQSVFNQILRHHNKDALIAWLASYKKHHASVPRQIQYTSMIATVLRRSRLFHLIFDYYEDTVAIALEHNMPTPIHHAVFVNNDDACTTLCERTNPESIKAALHRQQSHHLWNNKPLTPIRLAHLYGTTLKIHNTLSRFATPSLSHTQ